MHPDTAIVTKAKARPREASGPTRSVTVKAWCETDQGSCVLSAEAVIELPELGGASRVDHG